jgi:plasmid stabilization system protein ParE
MAKLVVMEEAGLDIRRLTEFLLQAHPEDAVGLVDNIISALKILEQHPEIGRPYKPPLRELVISRGKSGYLALYWFNPLDDRVEILRIRHQRESGYRSY